LSTFVVNSTADDGTSGTLRWAVAQANQHGSPSSIEFQLINQSGTIVLTQGQLELTNTLEPVSIYDGPGYEPVTISGNHFSRVFQVDQGVTASFSGLTITAGSSGGSGGGVYNQGNTTLSDCTISGSSATLGGGLADLNGGVLTLVNSTISGNQASFGGGGVFNS